MKRRTQIPRFLKQPPGFSPHWYMSWNLLTLMRLSFPLLRLCQFHCFNGYQIIKHNTKTLSTNCTSYGSPPSNAYNPFTTNKLQLNLLKTLITLLQTTLNHPNPSISNPTITFWNSTYGVQTNLD